MSARRFYRRHGNSIKVTGIQASGGAAVAVIDSQLLSSDSAKAMIGTNTFIKPLLVIGLAHVVKSKAANFGAGMAGAGGYMLATTYFAQPKPPAVQGMVEAGALREQPNAFGPGRMDNRYDNAGAVYEVVPE